MDQSKLGALAERLITLPVEISEAQTSVLEATINAQEVQNEITQTEANLKQEIASEIYGDGKKVYPNDDARKAAFIERVANEPALVSLHDEFNALQRSIQVEKILIEQLSNEQRNIRALLFFFGKGSED